MKAIVLCLMMLSIASGTYKQDNIEYDICMINTERSLRTCLKVHDAVECNAEYDYYKSYCETFK